LRRLPRPAGPRRSSKAAAEGLWSRPALLNLVADLLFVAAGLGLGYASVIAVQRLPLFPLRQLVVESPLTEVAPSQVEEAARAALYGNFFTVNLDGLRASFEKLPWVRRAAVRRLWPDGVAVAIEEHVAAARWRQAGGEMRLVNTRGEVFAGVSERADLPTFAGPEGMAAPMLAQYGRFSAALAPLGRKPQAMVLTQRQAWQLRLDDGLLLDLGRDQSKNSLDGRLVRFVASYAQVQERLKVRAALIDMRYPNGFALRPARAGEHHG